MVHQPRFILSGAAGGSTAGADAPNRLDIWKLVDMPVHFSLYVQALQKMFVDDQADITSFFAIGGIHGLPYNSWNGAGEEPVDPNAWQGYCTHANLLFPTWHRPYVALMEQVLQRTAITIAETYTVNKEEFKKAAMELRQPFWDWAADALPPPEVISKDYVDIIGPDGEKVPVPNPLRRYTFHPIDPSFQDTTFEKWGTTIRHPTTMGADAKDNVDGPRGLIATLNQTYPKRKLNTYFTLTRLHTWPEFSNKASGNKALANSLETIHDGVHDNLGGLGPGHMGHPAVAGFDPIFWLHHCNVDRQLALWSAVNHGVWVTKGQAGRGTWTLPQDAPIDGKTALTPFWKSADDTATPYWTSADDGNAGLATAPLGYTYPDFNGLDMGNPQQVKIHIRQHIEKLYGSLGGFEIPQPVAANHGPAVADWTVRVQIKQAEVGQSFAVFLFLGPVPPAVDAADWLFDETCVGTYDVFVNSLSERCANCREQEDLVVEGFVHLTGEIIQHAPTLASLRPQVVVPYLTDTLNWGVRKIDGTAVALDTVPSLEVDVAMTPLTMPLGAGLPEAGEVKYYHEITRGKQGGSRV
ncbi:Di-copper centre-containing protein [Mycena indigotica]|uniref:tyrosinase n=1 Tax=Mycena indigotica TaxID=2126181 RepID=A0A8H6S0L4_9AGAR|nr:Di-copper centre-containing protein [Mycena indigotica]KAF7290719.1 Di-copper centre-containing protein [Mycena indigotica]